MVGRNLQGVHSQRKEYFREGVLGFRLLFKSLIEFRLMIPQNLLGDQVVLLVLIMFQLQQKKFVVFTKLNLVAVNRVSELLGRTAILQLVELL